MPDRIAALDALDPIASKVGKLVRGVFAPRPVKDILGGKWLGHPVHPMLTDVTIGTFTSALLLDWLGGGGGPTAARRLIGIGLLSAPPVAAAGAHDLAD